MRITFAQRMVKTTVLAVLVATPIALACNHMSEFTVSRPNCRACTATGPVAQNPGGSCGYEVTFASVFCDCNPNLDCRSAVDGVNVVVAWYRGTCVGIQCSQAVPMGADQGYRIRKVSVACK
jgi:hypothetical protein